jgi:probable F420-dependent oxidoreductase
MCSAQKERKQMTYRPFRFGVTVGLLVRKSKAEWISAARWIEQAGYTTLLASDHMHVPMAPMPALTAAALATSTLRVGTAVLSNDFRHPAILAKEVATLDVLSDGRFELGIGAGWFQTEYEQAGIPFDTGVTRLERLEEAVRIIKGTFTQEPVTFSGHHYSTRNLVVPLKPLQQPRIPLLIGGSSKRILSFAAREASIVGLMMRPHPDTVKFDPTKQVAMAGPQQQTRMLPGSPGFDEASIISEAVQQKIEWVRQSARERFSEIELHTLVPAVAVTNDREKAAQALAAKLRLTPEQVLASPHCLVGTINQICETIKSRREQYGISYLTISEEHMEAFAPVVARLAGS